MFLRLVGYLFGIGAVFFLAIAAGLAWYVTDLSTDLPNSQVLNNYEPPVMTRIHAADGELMAEYSRERRMYLPIQAIPERLKAAFISAEDKNFYSHSGFDYFGIARAVLQNVESYFTGEERLVGASTITQQVAKNFFLSADQTWDRKLKEAILALRIEDTLTKDKILELYMNENNLGMGAYGVASGAQIYFGKSVHELTLAECAYLAAVLKAPSNYHPFRYADRAIERRNWVVDRMVENGYATAEEGETAKATPLGVISTREAPRVFTADRFGEPYVGLLNELYGEGIRRDGGISVNVASYFAEEVRRQLIGLYGEDRLYGGGLSVRTSLDPQMQVLARHSLMEGLISFDEERGWRGPAAHIELGEGVEWGAELAKVAAYYDIIEWKQAIVTGFSDGVAEIGLRPAFDGAGRVAAERVTGTIPRDQMAWARRSGRDTLKVGDVIYVSAVGGSTYRLQQIPEINGAMVAMNPQTGRVLALVGGFSYAVSQFNRATQAMRQPGSSFKPFVYAAALDNGYTPSSVVMDAPIEIVQSGQVWRPENYSNQFYGPSTLRTGIEQSRNVMTVRLAQDMGMPLVSEYSRRFGIYDNLSPLLSMALGSGETTVLRLVSAYAVIANGGRAVKPTLIDRIQDRYGETIFQHEDRICEECLAAEWSNQDEPTIVDNREQVLDPMTAYQVTEMMEGVVQRGTAASLRALGRPLAGKTGTTNDYHDAWFVGYSPDLVVGVFMGYDNPRSLGSGNTGGVMAAPVFGNFMRVALANQPPTPFRVPAGIQLIPIDRRTGLLARGGDGGTILEAFKPGTAPPESYSIIGYTDQFGRPLTVTPEADRAVIQGVGGLY